MPGSGRVENVFSFDAPASNAVFVRSCGLSERNDSATETSFLKRAVQSPQERTKPAFDAGASNEGTREK